MQETGSRVSGLQSDQERGDGSQGITWTKDMINIGNLKTNLVVSAQKLQNSRPPSSYKIKNILCQLVESANANSWLMRSTIQHKWSKMQSVGAKDEERLGSFRNRWEGECKFREPKYKSSRTKTGDRHGSFRKWWEGWMHVNEKSASTALTEYLLSSSSHYSKQISAHGRDRWDAIRCFITKEAAPGSMNTVKIMRSPETDDFPHVLEETKYSIP